MSASTLKELQTRNEDMLCAMAAIGRVVTNDALKPTQKTDRVLGILSLYDIHPTKETP